MNRRTLIQAAVLAAAGFPGLARAGGPVIAQGRPITLLVPLAAGSDTDAIARLVADGMARDLGQPVVVENRPGAGGQIALQAMQSSPADGSRLVIGIQAAVTILPHLRSKPPYDPTRDFTPIGRLATTANALIVGAGSPIRDLPDLLARARSGKLTYASWGIGSGGHLGGEILNVEAGIASVHVPYKGTAEVIQAVLSGEVDYAFVGYGLATSQSQAGRVRVLAVLGSQRSPTWPEAPTLKEAGFSLVQDAWFALLAPAGMAEATRSRLEAAMFKAAQAPALVERLKTLGITPAPTPGPALKTIIDADFQTWGGWVDRLGIPKT